MAAIHNQDDLNAPIEVWGITSIMVVAVLQLGVKLDLLLAALLGVGLTTFLWGLGGLLAIFWSRRTSWWTILRVIVGFLLLVAAALVNG